MKDSLKGVNKLKFITGMLVSIIDSLTYFILPLIISIYLNDTSDMDMIKTFVFIFIGFIVIRILGRMYMRGVMDFYLVKVSYIISNNVLNKVFNSDIKLLQLKGSGYVNSAIKRYNSSLDKVIEITFYSIPDSIISISIFIYATLTKSISLGLIALITIVINSIIYIYLQKKQEYHMNKYNVEESEYEKHYVDYILNIRTVKLLNIYEYIKMVLDKKTDCALSNSKQKYFIEGLKETTANILTFIPIILGIIFAVSEFSKGNSGIGLIIFFVMSHGNLKYAIRSIGDVSKALSEYRVAKHNLNECIANEGDQGSIKQFNKLQIKNLKFKYETSSFEISIDNFEVKKHDKIAVLGKSGQGKTTLLNILSKNIKTDSIYIDDFKSNINIEYGYVTQEAEMFNTSIKQNLCVGKEISDEYIMELLGSVMLTHWFNNLKDGLETEIGEKGLKLSTGQKQRLNLVRAILQNKDVYILDEPTSNLDEHTEEKVIECINKYLGNKTLIIVTHRKRVLDLCNKVYEFNNHILGEVI